jgi:hypothetical protein
MTASRANGTTYYNTTGRTIFVNIELNTYEGAWAVLNVGGLTIAAARYDPAGNYTCTLSAPIPPGAGYYTASSSGFNAWLELR